MEYNDYILNDYIGGKEEDFVLNETLEKDLAHEKDLIDLQKYNENELEYGK